MTSDVDLGFPELTSALFRQAPVPGLMAWKQRMRELRSRLPRDFRPGDLPRRSPVSEPFIL